MKSLQDYTSTTSPYELYQFLAEHIINGKIRSFSELREFTRDIPLDTVKQAIYTRLFRLIQKLNWGFFSDLGCESYPKLWRQLVIHDKEFKTCGNLKSSLTISDIFVGVLDLHGYTQFCEKNKNNLSMLQMLDDMIQVDLVKIARKFNVLMQRKNGDEMILIAASAVDIVTVTLLIADYFSKKRLINVGDDSNHRSGYKIILQDMRISAGIAGGNKYTPFIITRDGDLSGGIINMAARLQSRANELSANHSRILVAKALYTCFANECKNGLPEFFNSKSVFFLDSGIISFKGVTISLHEILFDDRDKYKLEIEAELQNLYKAAEGKSWKETLYTNLALLLIKIFVVISPFRIEGSSTGSTGLLKNPDLLDLTKKALKKFQGKTDYTGAVNDLSVIIQLCQKIPDFDALCLEYARQILERYQLVAEEYEYRLQNKIKEKAPQYLPPKYRQIYSDFEKNSKIIDKLNEETLKHFSALELSLLWGTVVEEKMQDLPFAIYSGKK